MIERLYLKDALVFKEAELNFENSLVVITGKSGSGKSVLMNSLLSSFALSDANASLCECSVNFEIDDESIENDDINVFKVIKKEKSRYFLNNQSLSKKVVKNLATKNIKHLSLKDFSDFEPQNLLNILDIFIDKKEHQKNLEKLNEIFSTYTTLQNELEKIYDEEKRIVELKEFCSFEIEKINSIDPKIGEDEELLHVKKLLSKKEKIEELINESNNIFEFETQINSLLELLDVDSSFFDDSMNLLREHFDSANEKFDELNEMDIESILDRIEAIGELKRRYGSIEDILDYKETKIQELHRYENITIQKGNLESDIKKVKQEIEQICKSITETRKNSLTNLESEINRYLKELYLEDIKISLHVEKITKSGKDRLELTLNSTTLDKISSGEFTRLRLALMLIKSRKLKSSNGILFLDEIDANLSGEESMSVAKVLRKLSQNFQIFVISHQPQLTSMATQHFCVEKNKNESFVKVLDYDERVQEIARIISSDKITDQALVFAKELLESAKT
jgi:DNA repair protein RecN (Recombination protein N)